MGRNKQETSQSRCPSSISQSHKGMALSLPVRLEIQKRAIRTSGLRLKAFAGFPTQRKSKMISFIAKSNRSCSEKEKTKQEVLQYKLNMKCLLSSYVPHRWLLRGALPSVTGHGDPLRKTTTTEPLVDLLLSLCGVMLYAISPQSTE